MNILLYSENPEVSLQLCSLGRTLAHKTNGSLYAMILGFNVKELADKVAGTGVDKVYLLDDDNLKIFHPETYVNAVSSVTRRINPEVVLVGSTSKGKIVAGELAAELKCGSSTDIFKVELKNSELTLFRSIYSGMAVVKEELTSKPMVLCIKPGSYSESEIKDEKSEIEKVELEEVETKSRVLEHKPRESETELDKAEVVVVCGRGIEKREDLSIAEDLAEALNGLCGVSRPLAADHGWASAWVGLSGLTVKPKLYIGVGVSGQPQHIAGIRESETIIAINNDPNAPIFEYADYGVIGDLYQILPTLIRKLKSK